MPELHTNRVQGEPTKAPFIDHWIRQMPAKSSEFLAIHKTYEPTPLIRWKGLESDLGIRRIYVKYENGRFGLDSFKPLGALYAVAKLDLSRSPTLACATAGNHGCGVALAAQRAGLDCEVFLKGSPLDSRVSVLEALGARVTCLDLPFDCVYRRLLEAADRNDWLVLQDTSRDPQDKLLWNVICGYSVMTLEVTEALAVHDEQASHVFVQTGAGAFASSVAMGLIKSYGADVPTLILAEPDSAACFGASFQVGAPTTVAADRQTNMKRLDVGTCAAAAWQVLSQIAVGSLAITDAEAHAAADLWMSEGPGDHRSKATPSGAAGIAALVGASRAGSIRRKLGLTGESTVVLYLSETT